MAEQVIGRLPLFGVEQQLDRLDHAQRVGAAGDVAGRQARQRRGGGDPGGLQYQRPERVADQGVRRDGGAVRVPREQAAEPVPHRGFHHGRRPVVQPPPERGVLCDGQHRTGRHRAGEQRHRGGQIPVRLAQPVRGEPEHPVHPGRGGLVRGQFRAEGFEISR